MRYSTIASLLLAALPAFAAAQTPHGEGAEEEMGPVAFMWPADRLWNDDDDNTGPCGSTEGPSNRTDFPLLNGAVALTIDEEAWAVTIRISNKENPTQQSDFKDLTPFVSELQPGHQCYSAPELSRDIEEGDLATLQIEYSAIDNNANVSHFACADIKFVPVSQFKTQVPCFNVTSEEFVEKADDDDDESSAFRLNAASGLGAAALAFFVSFMV